MLKTLNRRFTAMICIASLCLTINGCLGLDSGKKTFSPNDANVNLADVVTGDISLRLSGSGYLIPAKTTNLYYQDLSGPLKQMYVKQNDYVKVGQPIAEIDPIGINDRLAEQRFTVASWPTKMAQMADNLRTAEYNKKQAKTALDSAIKRQEAEDSAKDTADVNEDIQNTLNRDQLSNQYETAKSNYNNAVRAKQLAENEYNKQKKEYQVLDPVGMESSRYNQLAWSYQLAMDQWPIKLQQLNENIRIAEINQNQAKASLDSFDKINKNKDTIKEKQKLSGSLNETLAISQLKLQYDLANSAYQNAVWNKDLAQMQYDRDKLNLSKLNQSKNNKVLKSPINGKVIFVEQIEPTEMVSSSQVLVRLADPRNTVFRMPFVDARYLNGDELVKLDIDNQSYDARIYIPQAGDQLTEGNRAPNPNMVYFKFSSILPDIEYNKMIRAEVSISKSDTLIIPRSALRQEKEKLVVDVVKDNILESVEVERGISNDHQVEILSGLSPGQKVAQSY